MYLRRATQKRKDGSTLTHLQIAENSWDPQRQRSKVKILLNCGREDNEEVTERLHRLARSILRRCAPEQIVQENPEWKFINAWDFGDVHVLEQLWERIGIPQVLKKVLGKRRLAFAVERALFAMVANRACAPVSKLGCYTQWLARDVRIPGTQSLQLHHLYRAMDVLVEHQEALEEAIYYRISDLFNLDVELIFYDTTSLHFEIEQEDSSEAGEQPALRKRGYSKNGRGDAPQVVIGLAVTRDGFPVRHWVFPGNTVDVSTVERVKRELRGWRLNRCIFVGDAGMVSKSNLQSLARGGGRYIVAVPVHSGGEVEREVLSRKGRYQPVTDSLQVKEVVVGKGERRRRYVACYNPQEAKRQKRHRAQVLEELEAEIKTLRDPDARGHSKRVCALRSSKRYGRYVRLTPAGKPAINLARVRAAERLDGKFVVYSNDDSLSAADMALGYKQLQRVEQAWRRLKSGLRLRPVYHWTPQRIRAHISLTVLALLLERVAEQSCTDTWRNIQADLREIKLSQLLGPNGTVWQVSEPQAASRKRLKMLGIKAPSPIFSLS